jgi:phosphate/sulfate permease
VPNNKTCAAAFCILIYTLLSFPSLTPQQATHDRAKRYDNKVERPWTYATVASAMIMSIAHSSNDVANAVGPWAAAYATYQSGKVSTKEPTPTWMLGVAGTLLGLGFWVYGYHIIRSLGNKITQMSPTRGFSMELRAAITVLIASQLSLPVSATQCLTSATIGVVLMIYDVRAVNWRQLFFIFCDWCLTLPTTALISGLLMAMALNTPHFGIFPLGTMGPKSFVATAGSVAPSPTDLPLNNATAYGPHQLHPFHLSCP